MLIEGYILINKKDFVATTFDNCKVFLKHEGEPRILIGTCCHIVRADDRVLFKVRTHVKLDEKRPLYPRYAVEYFEEEEGFETVITLVHTFREGDGLVTLIK